MWTPGGQWGGLNPGSPAWHVGYLLSLCAMAATAAFLRDARSPRRVLLLGAACTGLAVLTGLEQLP